MIEVLWRTTTGQILGERLLDADLSAPSILDAEVASFLRRMLLAGASRSVIQQAFEIIRGWRIERIAPVDLIAESTRWWNNVTAYDALYLATASRLDGTVLTVDGPLSRAPTPGVRVENVRVRS